MAGATPSQTVGPFFHYALTDDHSVTDLVSPETRGRRITIQGRVFDMGGAGVPDAMIEIWQANSHGRFDHPEDRQDKPLDPAFRGFGRCATDENGFYSFRTVMPGAVPGHGNTLQAPHVLVNVLGRGLLKQLVTRIYFEGEPLNASDPVLALIEDEDRRATLIAQATQEEGTFNFDIRLSGDGETVFFEV